MDQPVEDATENQQEIYTGRENQTINAEKSEVHYNPNNSTSNTVINNIQIVKKSSKSRTFKNTKRNSDALAAEASIPALPHNVADLMEDSSLETVSSDTSEEYSLPDSDCDKSVDRSIRCLILGDSASSNRKVWRLLQSDADVSSNAVPESQDGHEEIRIIKADDVTFIENSSLLKQSKRSYVETLDLVLRICKCSFPGPNIVILVVKSDGGDICKNVKLQLRKIKRYFGFNVAKHMMHVLESFPFDIDDIDKQRVMKIFRYKPILLGAKFNKIHVQRAKERMVTEMREMVKTDMLCGKNWFGDGAFMTTNKLLCSAVFDMKEEIKSHFGARRKTAKKSNETDATITVTKMQPEVAAEDIEPNIKISENCETSKVGVQPQPQNDNSAQEKTKDHAHPIKDTTEDARSVYDREKFLSATNIGTTYEKTVESRKQTSENDQPLVINANKDSNKLSATEKVKEFEKVETAENFPKSTKEVSTNTEAVQLAVEFPQQNDDMAKEKRKDSRYLNTNFSQKDALLFERSPNTANERFPHMKTITKAVGTNTETVSDKSMEKAIIYRKKTENRYNDNFNKRSTSEKRIETSKVERLQEHITQHDRRITVNNKTKKEKAKKEIESLLIKENENIEYYRNRLQGKSPKKRKHDKFESPKSPKKACRI